MQPLLAFPIASEQDVVLARQRARQVAQLLGFDGQDLARIATSVSEIVRNVVNYAGKGRMEVRVEGRTPPQVLAIDIVDEGPGIPHLVDLLAGRYRSETGMGLGLLGARRLMDRCDIDSVPGKGTSVRLKKILPPTAPFATSSRLAGIGAEIAGRSRSDPYAEIKQQNQELIRTMDALKARQEELVRLNHELEDTNRGVLALYAELDEKADHLRRADEMKSRFLSNMSHELRTPLNSIMALAHILQERIDGDLTAEQLKQVGFIRKSAESLTELVNDLLDMAKVEAGKTEIAPDDFEVEELFGALRGMLRPLLVGESVRLVFEEPEGVGTIHGDEGKVSQILRNFISNALKFTERGEIRISARRDGEQVEFAVADTGIGIAPEDRERIFEEFTQVRHSLQARVKGTGLGLPLSRKLAALLQGSVTLESDPGRGSTFRLRIPVRFVPQDVAIAPEAPTPARVDPARMPLLVVEDSAEDVDIYRSFFRNTEFQLFDAANPQAARAALRDIAPVALLLDIQLRGQDTWKLLAETKNENPSLPVVVLSSVDDEQKALGLGADAYLHKPVDRPTLLKFLRTRTRPRRRGKILVVDDDELARYTMVDALRRTAYDVQEAAGGEEGLARALADPPVAIFLDLDMPDRDGFSVLEELKARVETRDVPVVIVTSMSLGPRELALLEGRAFAVLSKGELARSGRDSVEEILAAAGLAQEKEGATRGVPATAGTPASRMEVEGS